MSGLAQGTDSIFMSWCEMPMENEEEPAMVLLGCNGYQMIGLPNILCKILFTNNPYG
jgi:hypothetical protein